jgi:iron complex outermembrane receptor protein
VREDYRSCTGQPCSTAQTLVRRGQRLPGIAAGQWYSRLGYRPTPDWQLAATFRHLDAVPVSDSGSETAPSYGLLDLDASTRWRPARGPALRWSLAVENLLDQRHAGSVIVNEANGRHYEPGRGRTLRAGLELTLPQ